MMDWALGLIDSALLIFMLGFRSVLLCSMDK